MIDFSKFQLANGLRVIVHRDPLTPLAVTNVVYNAGSKFDPPHLTGMAHLFEHLMFGGSKNAGDFDLPQQLAGGENNAFTNADITNYYQVLPGANLEIALWLESERMGFLNLNEKTLQIQKEVVLEEYNETCLNEPYGDAWHYIHHMAYTKYPYRWPTIGMTPDHIKNIELKDATEFYSKYYHPSNAVLVITGNVDVDQSLHLVEKWFGSISSGNPLHFLPESEPPQTQLKRKKLKAIVPVPAVYMAFRIPSRLDKRFPAIDLLSDLLGLGRSSRLNELLVEKWNIFTAIDAYVNGTNDMGLFIIEGKLNDGETPEKGEEMIWKALDMIKSQKIEDGEMSKLKNTFATTLEFSSLSNLHKAMNLAYFENLGSADMINTELDEYNAIDDQSILEEANTILKPENCSVLLYFPEKLG